EHHRHAMRGILLVEGLGLIDRALQRRPGGRVSERILSVDRADDRAGVAGQRRDRYVRDRVVADQAAAGVDAVARAERHAGAVAAARGAADRDAKVVRVQAALTEIDAVVERAGAIRIRVARLHA